MASGQVVAGGDIPVIPTDQMNIVEVPGERQEGRGPHTASVMEASQLGSPRHTAPYSPLSISPAVRVLVSDSEKTSLRPGERRPS